MQKRPPTPGNKTSQKKTNKQTNKQTNKTKTKKKMAVSLNTTRTARARCLAMEVDEPPAAASATGASAINALPIDKEPEAKEVDMFAPPPRYVFSKLSK